VGGDFMIKRIAIGKITAPHGVRGEFRLFPLTDFPERFKTLETAYLQDGRQVKVEYARPHKQFFLVKLQGFDTPEVIATLRNMTLEVDQTDVAALPPGHFYIFDIIGMQVVTEEEEDLGTVVEVLETGSNDVYVVEKNVEGSTKKQQILIPALKTVVLCIDVPTKKMVVRLPEGLI
jgi:16S rRNA processing protein RimM